MEESPWEIYKELKGRWEESSGIDKEVLDNKRENMESINVSAVQILIFRLEKSDKQIFLGKRATSSFDQMWSVPGGKIDSGETLFEAAQRELEEETGLVIAKDELTHIARGESETTKEVNGREMMVVYQIDLLSMELPIGLNPINNSPDEHDEMGWFSIEDALRLKLTPFLREYLSQI